MSYGPDLDRMRSLTWPKDLRQFESTRGQERIQADDTYEQTYPQIYITDKRALQSIDIESHRRTDKFA